MTALWSALDSNDQMALTLVLTMFGGLCIACWSWHRATQPPPPAKVADPRDIAYDWSVEAWADFERAEADR